MKIIINNLCFDTIIGILEKERRIPQKVLIHAKITYLYSTNDFINYAILAQHFIDTMQTKRYGLLEDALQDLANMTFQKFPNIQKMTLFIQKPDIIQHCVVGLQAKFTHAKLNY